MSEAATAGSNRSVFSIDPEGDVYLQPDSFDPTDKIFSWIDKGGHEVAMCVELEGKMHCTGKMTAAPVATPTHIVQCTDLAAHVECRKELLALRDEGRALNNYGGVFVIGFGGMAILLFIFMWFGRRSKTLRTTTDAQPGNPIIRVELPGVVRER